MKRFGRRLGSVLCSSLLVTVLGLPIAGPTQAAGPPSGLTVNIENTPLPVAVSNFPPSSTVSGSVSITGTPNVNVANPPSNPVPTRDVDHPSQQPFHAQTLIVNNFPNGFFDHVTLATVPEGKRLVLELVSASAEWPSGQRLVKVLVSVTTDGILSSHRVAVSAQGTSISGNDEFVASQALRLYADPGTRVIVSFFRNSNAGGGSVQLAVTGYLVDL